MTDSEPKITRRAFLGTVAVAPLAKILESKLSQIGETIQEVDGHRLTLKNGIPTKCEYSDGVVIQFKESDVLATQRKAIDGQEPEILSQKSVLKQSTENVNPIEHPVAKTLPPDAIQSQEALASVSNVEIIQLGRILFIAAGAFEANGPLARYKKSNKNSLKIVIVPGPAVQRRHLSNPIYDKVRNLLDPDLIGEGNSEMEFSEENLHKIIESEIKQMEKDLEDSRNDSVLSFITTLFGGTIDDKILAIKSRLDLYRNVYTADEMAMGFSRNPDYGTTGLYIHTDEYNDVVFVAMENRESKSVAQIYCDKNGIFHLRSGVERIDPHNPFRKPLNKGLSASLSHPDTSKIPIIPPSMRLTGNLIGEEATNPTVSLGHEISHAADNSLDEGEADKKLLGAWQNAWNEWAGSLFGKIKKNADIKYPFIWRLPNNEGFIRAFKRIPKVSVQLPA